MSPDGKDWTVTLRQGIPFHDNWGEFTARDVRHAVFLISQPEAAASDTSIWRSGDGGRPRPIRSRRWPGKSNRAWRSATTTKSYFHLQQAVPEFLYMISANADLVMESKARWDAGGKDSTGRRWWARAPLSSSSARWARTCCTNGLSKALAPYTGLQRTGVPLGARGRHTPGHPSWRTRCTSPISTAPCSGRP